MARKLAAHMVPPYTLHPVSGASPDMGIRDKHTGCAGSTSIRVQTARLSHEQSGRKNFIRGDKQHRDCDSRWVTDSMPEVIEEHCATEHQCGVVYKVCIWEVS